MSNFWPIFFRHVGFVAGGVASAFAAAAVWRHRNSLTSSFRESFRRLSHLNVELPAQLKLSSPDWLRCSQRPERSWIYRATPVKEWNSGTVSTENKCLYCTEPSSSKLPPLVVFEKVEGVGDKKSVIIYACKDHRDDAIRDGAACLHNSHLINPNWPDQWGTLLSEIHRDIVKILETVKYVSREGEKNKFPQGANKNSVVRHAGAQFLWQFTIETVISGNNRFDPEYFQYELKTFSWSWSEWEQKTLGPLKLDEKTMTDLKANVDKFEACALASVQKSGGPHSWAQKAQSECQAGTIEGNV